MRLFTLFTVLFLSSNAIAEVNVSGSMGGVTLPASCKAGEQGISINLQSKLITFYCGDVKYDCQAESIDSNTLATLDFNTAKFSLKCGDMSKAADLTLFISSFYATLTDYNARDSAPNPCVNGCKIVNFSYDAYTKLLTYFKTPEAEGQDPELAGCYLQENDKTVFTNESTLSVYACVNAIDDAGQIILTNGDIIFNDSFDNK